MPGRDKFLRAWYKRPTGTLDQTLWRRLSIEEDGVFDLSMTWSVRSSSTPGYFLDRELGTPLSLEDIALMIKPIGQQEAAVVRIVDAAFRRFLELGIALHNDDDGYYFEPSLVEQFLHQNNLEAKRKADTARQARRRERGKKAVKGRPSLRPVDIRSNGARAAGDVGRDLR